MPDTLIQPGEAAVFLGVKGAGKSHLVLSLLAQGGAGGRPLQSVVVMESKHDPDEWLRWGPALGFAVSRDPADVSRYPRLVLLVDQVALNDREGWRKPGAPGWTWSDALLRVWARGHTIVLFNEALNTLPMSGPHPQAQRIQTQGRSVRVTAWAESQRPRWLDPMALRLAEHCFSFAMFDGADRDYLRETRSVDSGELAGLEPFHFAHHRLGEPSWTQHPPLNPFAPEKERPTDTAGSASGAQTSSATWTGQPDERSDMVPGQ